MLGLCADNCVGRGRTEDEGVDRSITTLPGAQQPLLEAVSDLISLVMLEGREDNPL